jgi:hypothetical protein
MKYFIVIQCELVTEQTQMNYINQLKNVVSFIIKKRRGSAHCITGSNAQYLKLCEKEAKSHLSDVT